MRIIRRLGAVAVSGALLGALLTVQPATASTTPEAFAGTATARALNLDALGIKLTAGATHATADSTPKAHADGAGVAIIAGTVSSADIAGANQTNTPPNACALNLPLPAILTLALACSQSSAVSPGGLATGSAAANVATIDVAVLNAVLNLLKPITDALAPVADKLIGSVTATLQPLLGPLLTPLLGNLGINLQTPVSSLLTALQKITSLATISLGPSASVVNTVAGSITATASAKGGEIDILPGLALAGGPLIKIVLGSATATSTFNRTTGVSSATFDPALLTLSVLGMTIPVTTGSPVTLFAGTVLESTIAIGAGSTVHNADGTVGAVADGLSLHLLKGLNGGINLELAHAESAVGGTPQIVTPDLTTTTTVAPQVITTPPTNVGKLLALTGPELPFLPIGFFLILAGLLTRRAIRSRR
ncbi:MAG: hypothetical protein M3N98_01285 [Actinomycetota bacterium]|nr:hypothetical protein [Actinomycetota bacterium]